MGKNEDKFARRKKDKQERAEKEAKIKQQEADARVAQINAAVVRLAAEAKAKEKAAISEPTKVTEQTPPIASEVMPELEEKPEASEPNQATEQTPPIASEVMPELEEQEEYLEEKLEEEPEVSEPTQATEQTSSETFNPSPRASTVTSDQEKEQIAHAAENDKAIRRAIYNLHKVLCRTPYEPTEGRLPEEMLDLDGILCKLIPAGIRYDWEDVYINDTSKLNEEHILMLPEKTQLVIEMLDRKIKAEPTYSVILKTFYNQLVDAFNIFKKAVYPETHTITPKWETAHEKYSPTKTNMKEALQNIRDAHQENEPSPDSPRSRGGR